jgi:hypothetical protein
MGASRSSSASQQTGARRLAWFALGPTLPMGAVLIALYVLAIVYIRQRHSPPSYVPPHVDVLHWGTLAAVPLSGLISTWLWPPPTRISAAVLEQPMSATPIELLQLVRSGLLGMMTLLVVLVEVAGFIASLVALPACHYETCWSDLAGRLSVLALIAAGGCVLALGLTRLLLRIRSST